MNAKPAKQQPTKWDSKKKRISNKIKPYDQRAMLAYYDAQTRKGSKSRDEILWELSNRYGRHPRRIEAHIARAREATEKKIEEKALHLIERAGKMQDFEKVHGGSLRDLASRLQSEIAVPTVWDIYALPGGDRYQCGSGLYWRMLKSGTVDMTLSLENEADTRHLYSALMSHLTTGRFPDAPGMIDGWKSLLIHYLQECYGLLGRARNDLKSELNVDIPHRYAKHTPGPTAWFPLTACISALQTAGGSTATRTLEYERYPLDRRLYQLKYGAFTIAIASPEQTLDMYRELHEKFQARLAGSGEVAAIVELRKKLTDRVALISDELVRFALTTPVPGHCHHCKASGTTPALVS